jgi:hypothetical protein
MKASFLAVALLSLLFLRAPEVQAQAYNPYYGPFWDAQYQQYLQYQHELQWQHYLQYLQQYDPYYELHVMHYQLYRQRYYQPYPMYLPCCYGFGIFERSTPVGRVPQATTRGARRAATRK